jgi:V8-like Glu-specific endopeptidase
MVSSFHFLTAAHCVHGGAGSNWFTGIGVAMGQDGQDRWFGLADWTTMRTYNGWTNSSDWDWDFALITLDRPVGSHVGWLGREWWGNDSVYNGMTVNTAGYPSDKPNSTMWWATGPTSFADSQHVYYNGTMDTFAGQSGSPVWRYDGTDRFVNAVHAYGGGTNNSGTRMTQTKFNDVSDWIAADAAPPQRPDLVDYDAWFSTSAAFFSPDPVKPGQNFSKTAYVQNNGFSSGGYWVDFYASTNNIISTGDTFIGSVFISSTGSYTWSTATDTTAFPTIAAGNYYVGWIIDATGSQTEYDESNNTGVITSNLLAVLPAAPGVLNATPVSTSQIDLSWTDVAGETGYKIERSPNGASGWVQIGTTLANDTTFSSTGLSAGTQYFYRVRAYTGAGDGNYSPTDSAYTYVAAPSTLNAVGGFHHIKLSWTNIVGENGYRIERSSNGVSGWVQIATVGANVTTYTNKTLPHNATYFYRVRGFNINGNGAYSPVDSATTTAPNPTGGLTAQKQPGTSGRPPMPAPAPGPGRAPVTTLETTDETSPELGSAAPVALLQGAAATIDGVFALSPWENPLLVRVDDL